MLTEREAYNILYKHFEKHGEEFRVRMNKKGESRPRKDGNALLQFFTVDHFYILEVRKKYKKNGDRLRVPTPWGCVCYDETELAAVIKCVETILTIPHD